MTTMVIVIVTVTTMVSIASSDHDESAVKQSMVLMMISGSSNIVNSMSLDHQHDGKPTPRSRVYRCKEKRSYNELFMSQSKEDQELLFQYGFDQLCGGSYLEMGGLDGIQYSNSHVFNKALDWKGVLIEASPTSFQRLVENRKNEIATINAGVCREERELHWVSSPADIPAVHGFIEFAAESFKKRWWDKAGIKNAKIVKCRTLKNILTETVGNDAFFDFFSLDVEGAEYEVLSSIDFSLVSFGVIFVENDDHNLMKNLAVRALLENNGYIYIKQFARSAWFVNQVFGSIYDKIFY